MTSPLAIVRFKTMVDIPNPSIGKFPRMLVVGVKVHAATVKRVAKTNIRKVVLQTFVPLVDEKRVGKETAVRVLWKEEG